VIPEESIHTQYSEIIARISKSYNAKIIFWVSILVSVLITLWVGISGLSFQYGIEWFTYLRWPFLLFELPKTFVTVYATSYIGFRILIIQWGISEIYRRLEINVQPLHPDGAGGLASVGGLIGSYVFWLFPAVAFVASAGIYEYSRHGIIPEYLIIQFVLLPFFTIVVFFLPLQSSHSAMQASAERVMLRLNQNYQRIVESISSDGEYPTKEQLDTLGHLIELQTRMRGVYPTWPLSSGIFRRFTLSLTASGLPLLITLVEKYVIKILP
jgi:hypothetical protein